MSFRRRVVIVTLLAAGACGDKAAPAAEEAVAPAHQVTSPVGAPDQGEPPPPREASLPVGKREPIRHVTSPVGAPDPDQDMPPSAAQLPVPEDFHAETAAAIVRANYLTELDKLEGELRADEY